jgi:hypothetical protein
MTSVGADVAASILDSEALPECACDCPSCQRSSSIREGLARADEHNLWAWIQLRDSLGPLDMGQRVERYRFRLEAAARQLAAARRSIPDLRSLRHIALADRTVANEIAWY